MALLYERLASELADGIKSGLLRPGERLPSVRVTCQTRQVSPSTVFQAYALLESRGLVEVRARSGYYVSAQLSAQRLSTTAPVHQLAAQPVAISEMVFELLGSTRDVDVVPLGSAFLSPELFPFAELARCGSRALRRLTPAHITGALTAGDEALRELLHHRYTLQGVRLRKDELVITNGALEALNLCLQAVTQPGDVVLVESPTFYAALQALERLHLKALEVPTDPAEGVDLAALQEILARQPVAACWFMPNFQNPLGALMPNDKKQALMGILERHGVPLIEDDVYAELYAGLRRPLAIKALDEAGLVLHCSSFSKCLAPGYRVGWAAAGKYARTVERLKMMSSLATSLPAQRAIAEYLKQGTYDRHLRSLRQTLAAQMQRTLRQIERYFPPDTRVTQPSGGYFVWVELPRQVDTLVLHRQALEARISIAPGPLFSSDRRFRHHIRLNTGHPGNEKVDQALRTIGKLAC